MNFKRWWVAEGGGCCGLENLRTLCTVQALMKLALSPFLTLVLSMSFLAADYPSPSPLFFLIPYFAIESNVIGRRP